MARAGSSIIRWLRTPRATRRGQAISKLLLVTCLVLIIAATRFFGSPASLLAGFERSNETNGDEAIRRQFLSALARLIEQSSAVLAVHNRAATAYVEIVLWRDDLVNPGVIDPSEVLLVSHSQLLQNITVYVAPAQQIGIAAPSQASQDSARVPVRSVTRAKPRNVLDGPLSRSMIADPEFCDHWRMNPLVKPQILGAGISDLLIETRGPAGDEWSLLRLTLRWGGKSADAGREASVLVKASSRPQGAVE